MEKFYHDPLSHAVVVFSFFPFRSLGLGTHKQGPFSRTNTPNLGKGGGKGGRLKSSGKKDGK